MDPEALCPTRPRRTTAQTAATPAPEGSCPEASRHRCTRVRPGTGDRERIGAAAPSHLCARGDTTREPGDSRIDSRTPSRGTGEHGPTGNARPPRGLPRVRTARPSAGPPRTAVPDALPRRPGTDRTRRAIPARSCPTSRGGSRRCACGCPIRRRRLSQPPPDIQPGRWPASGATQRSERAFDAPGHRRTLLPPETGPC